VKKYHGDEKEGPGKKGEEDHKEKIIWPMLMGHKSGDGIEALPRRRSSWFCF
jgi:hypothetical protein